MADGGKDCYSTSDLHFDVTVVDSSDGETDSDDVSEEFSEDDDVVNLCKIIKKFKFLCGSLMYANDCQTEFPRLLLYGPVEVCRVPVIEWRCSPIIVGWNMSAFCQTTGRTQYFK